MSVAAPDEELKGKVAAPSLDSVVIVTHGLEHDEEVVKRAWRKVDMHIMPIAVLLYLASYIDRYLALSFHAQFNCVTELHN